MSWVGINHILAME